MSMPGPIAILPFIAATAISIAMEAELDRSRPELRGPSAKLQAAVDDGRNAIDRLQLSGDVDRDFARLMLKHQEQSVAMNEIVLEYGEDEDLQALARRLGREQQKHLEVLKREQESGAVPVAVVRAARKP